MRPSYISGIKGYAFVAKADSERPYEELAAAIIRQAIYDHYDYHRHLKMWERKAMDPDQSMSTCRSEINRLTGCLKSVKLFFYGQYIQQLCDYDGPALWRAIKQNWREGRKPLIGMGRESGGHKGRKRQ